MKTFKQVARENNFQATQVNRTEFEDGIGVQVGMNFVKNETFYTEDQMLAECGFDDVKFTSGKFQAESADDATRQLTDALQSAGVVAYQIQRKPYEYAANQYVVKVNYVK